MSTVNEVEKAVSAFSGAELAEFRRWFLEFDAQQWDAEFEADVKAGRLDELGASALAEFHAGRTQPL